MTSRPTRTRRLEPSRWRVGGVAPAERSDAQHRRPHDPPHPQLAWRSAKLSPLPFDFCDRAGRRKKRATSKLIVLRKEHLCFKRWAIRTRTRCLWRARRALATNAILPRRTCRPRATSNHRGTADSQGLRRFDPLGSSTRRCRSSVVAAQDFGRRGGGEAAADTAAAGRAPPPDISRRCHRALKGNSQPGGPGRGEPCARLPCCPIAMQRQCLCRCESPIANRPRVG